ncbi:MAG TPA: LacI family DNA-binding transcriptional regulator [Roseiarcus sp.]|nr:LacI family DNA-binding transcriptional regulator [Roseiarcus sp.]
MSRKPIIADVARLASVSTATVDRVLNDRGGVKPEKEIKVLSAARRLKLDRILTRRYSRVLRIAVLIQSSANPFHAALRDACAAASRAYADLNLQFLIHHIDPGDASEIAAAIRRLGPRHNGLILTSPDDRRIAAAIGEVAQKIPVITLATDLPGSGRWAYVGPDDRRAGRVAGDLMGRFLGREGGDIVMNAGLLSLVGQKERDAGFRQVLGERYPACRISAVFETRESAERAGLAILEALNENPAVRGVYHMTAGAPEAIAALRSQGRSKDVVVIAHELTEDRRALLKERAIDAVIDQNPEFEVRTATELMARFLGRMEGVASTIITAVQVYTSENV